MRRINSGSVFRRVLSGIRFSSLRSNHAPSGIAWLIAAALLFLIGAIANGSAGSRELTELGVLGAVVAIAFVAAFMG
jgi:hypothetical protein